MAFQLSAFQNAVFDANHVSIGNFPATLSPGVYEYNAANFKGSVEDINSSIPSDQIVSVTTAIYTGKNDPLSNNILTYKFTYGDRHTFSLAVKVTAVNKNQAIAVQERGFGLTNGTRGATLQPLNTFLFSFGESLSLQPPGTPGPSLPITLSQDGTGTLFDVNPVVATPEPSTAVLVAVAFVAFVGSRLFRRGGNRAAV